MAAAPTLNPGLDLSWLNIDEGWGAKAEPGKRGLTLEDLNIRVARQTRIVAGLIANRF